MHPAIIGIALGTQLVVQVSGDIPNFNLEKACKVLSEKADQSYNDCLNDEKSARQQLGSIWSSYPASIRAAVHQRYRYPRNEQRPGPAHLSADEG